MILLRQSKHGYRQGLGQSSFYLVLACTLIMISFGAVSGVAHESRSTGKGAALNPTESEHSPHKTYQKPGAAIRLNTPASDVYEVGETRTQMFEFTSRRKSGEALMLVSADDSLQIDITQAQRFDLKDGPVRLPIDITALQEGRHYIRFAFELDGMRRHISYGINVGYLPKPSQRQKASDELGIKRLQAQETVRQK